MHGAYTKSPQMLICCILFYENKSRMTYGSCILHDNKWNLNGIKKRKTNCTSRLPILKKNSMAAANSMTMSSLERLIEPHWKYCFSSIATSSSKQMFIWVRGTFSFKWFSSRIERIHVDKKKHEWCLHEISTDVNMLSFLWKQSMYDVLQLYCITVNETWMA